MRKRTVTIEEKENFVQKIENYRKEHPDISIEQACEEAGDGIGWWAFYRYRNQLRKMGQKAKRVLEKKQDPKIEPTIKTDHALIGNVTDTLFKLEIKVSKPVYDFINREAKKYLLSPDTIAQIYLIDQIEKIEKKGGDALTV